MIRVLFLGEIIGLPTVKLITNNISTIIQDYNIDFTIANADGASDGYGILSKTAYMLHKNNVNVLTSGDNVFNKKDVKTLLKFPFFLRPFNIPSVNGGRGSGIYSVNNDIQIGVINLLGRVNFTKFFAADPFYTVDKIIERIEGTTKIIIVDFHGGTTSEIQAMQWYLAGRVTAVIGTNLRVLTSDNRIANEKTAIITGTGICGGSHSIGGLQKEIEIKKIKNGLFIYSKIETTSIILEGVIIEIDEESGNAQSIELFREKLSNINMDDKNRD